jgi:hypothetical protein
VALGTKSRQPQLALYAVDPAQHRDLVPGLGATIDPLAIKIDDAYRDCQKPGVADRPTLRLTPDPGHAITYCVAAEVVLYS